jgi:hypothetical protein
VALGLASPLPACGPGFFNNNPSDIRVVKLRWVPPPASLEALGGTRSVQLVGIQVEGGTIKAVHAGEPVDSRSVQTLQVKVPEDVAVNLVVQTPRGNAKSVGQMVALVEWDQGAGAPGAMTSRLRAGRGDVDLGEPTFSGGDPSRLTDNRLTVAADRNPLLRTDRDSDGLNDYVDDDDDDDGLTDASDPDADGDQLADLDQALASLPDRNGVDDGDGIPDDLE